VGQNWFIDGGNRLGRTFTAFKERWFQRSFDGYGVSPLEHSQEEIEDKLRDVCLSLNAADYFDLDKPIETPIYIDLPPKARKMYNDMENTMYAELDEIGLDTIEAVNAAARTMKCLQLANGAAYVGEDNKQWKEIHDQKLKALEDVIEEAAGMPVLVAYHFKSDLARLTKHFKKGRVLDSDPKTIKEWNAGKIPILFAHPQSAGHGLNLQDGGNIIAFFSINWNLEHHEQIIERIGTVRQKQAGYDRPVFIYYIMARNTVEDLVHARLKSKAAVQQLLMQAMKARRT
jgi:SNF2 family DNA or RNA helicase